MGLGTAMNYRRGDWFGVVLAAILIGFMVHMAYQWGWLG